MPLMRAIRRQTVMDESFQWQRVYFVRPFLFASSHPICWRDCIRLLPADVVSFGWVHHDGTRLVCTTLQRTGGWTQFAIKLGQLYPPQKLHTRSNESFPLSDTLVTPPSLRPPQQSVERAFARGSTPKYRGSGIKPSAGPSNEWITVMEY